MHTSVQSVHNGSTGDGRHCRPDYTLDIVTSSATVHRALDREPSLSITGSLCACTWASDSFRPRDYFFVPKIINLLPCAKLISSKSDDERDSGSFTILIVPADHLRVRKKICSDLFFCFVPRRSSSAVVLSQN
jgi:hypothetical protein